MQLTSLNNENLFHISEEQGIEIFAPRPSPSKYGAIKGDVVFAITESLMHNYLLPRDCPRVTYYAKPGTSMADRDAFTSNSSAKYFITIEQRWWPIIERSALFCYEFPTETFELLDGCAGYYISYTEVVPVLVKRIHNPLTILLKRSDIELRVIPSLLDLAGLVAKSSLNFSLIRMRNAL